jgi:hypothetical protein
LDIIISGTIAGYLLVTIAFMFVPLTIDRWATFLSTPGGAVFDAMLTIFIGIPMNALMLGLIGTTPGKAIFGIRVRGSGLQRLGFLVALRRELSVWVFGLAMGIPVVAFFTLVAAYLHLKKYGRATWDETLNDGGFVVLYRQPSFLQFTLNLVGAVLLAGVVAALWPG